MTIMISQLLYSCDVPPFCSLPTINVSFLIVLLYDKKARRARRLLESSFISAFHNRSYIITKYIV